MIHPRDDRTLRGLAGLSGAMLLAAALEFPEASPLGAAEIVSRSGWVRVEYGPIVDSRQLSHSGESVGALLRKLDGRGVPRVGERPADLLAHRLLDPLLEVYGFVLPDVLDSLAPAHDLPRVEVGALWQPGETQPAWAELLRSRRLIVESDGEGRLRVFLPWTSRPAGAGTESAERLPGKDGEGAAREAWQEWWPVLRHVLAAEQRRLAGRPLEIDVHPFVHHPARAMFHLSLEPYRPTSAQPAVSGAGPPLDLAALSDFLESGQQLEGARLEPDGTLRYLGSRVPTRPTLLGGPVLLSDVAVAYRAVFHGGLSEPYMSLDRDFSPWTSLVTFGGRLQDTRLGLVSLLCDIRLKTFGLGLDILERADVRERLRKEIPSFRTHLERLAAHPRSRGTAGQQTRFWFYPDDVELTLSPEGDLFALRRVRMTASSERVLPGRALEAAEEENPPWTRETIVAINEGYDALSRLLPELGDLDQTARLLALFTWLREARGQGLPTPDLDVLLAVELPPLPTPRRLPSLLAYAALPEPGLAAGVSVFDQVAIGEAFARLDPRGGQPLPAWRRLERALRGLDRRAADHAAVASEIEDDKKKGDLVDDTLDLLAYRAERLFMHQRVLSVLDEEARDRLDARRRSGESLRAFSIGTGGVDLGMGQALARAKGSRLTLGAGRGEPAEAARPSRAPSGPGPIRPRSEASDEADSSRFLPPLALPDHGIGTSPRRQEVRLDGGSAIVVSRAHGDHEVRKISWAYGEGAEKGALAQTVLGLGSPDARARRRIQDPEGRAPVIERLEGPRFLRFRILPDDGGGLRAVPQAGELLPEIARLTTRPTPSSAAPSLPAGLAVLEVLRAPIQPVAGEEGTLAGLVEGTPVEPLTVSLRLGRGEDKDVVASFPRGVLQRLVLGREADLAPGRPLPGLTPPDQVLAGAGRLIVLDSSARALPAWAGPAEPLPGEEDGARIAEALRSWWAGEAGAGAPPSVIVGTDPATSFSRWQAAAPPDGKALLLLPEDAFPGLAAPLRAELARHWPEKQVVSALPSKKLPDLVVLASAEAPGLLGARLRDLARREEMRGKLLGVFSLSGPIRPDLPAALLAEGGIAGLGVAEISLLGWRRAPAALGDFSRALGGKRDRSRRVEDLPGPFLWFW